MIFTAFLAGLIMFLTPIVFPMAIQNFILFEKFGKTKKDHRINTFVFIFLTILLLTLLLPKIYSDVGLINNLANDKRIDYLLTFPLLLLIIWISFSFIKELKFLTEGNYLMALRILGLTYFSFRLFIGAFSGIGPILGTSSLDSQTIYTFSFAYSIGITFPLLIFMLILSTIYERLKDKKWWMVIQIIILIYLFGVLIVNLITD